MEGPRICFFVFFFSPSFDTIHSPWAEIFGKSIRQHIYLVSSLSFFNPEDFDWRQLGTIFDDIIGSEAFGVQKSYSSFFCHPQGLLSHLYHLKSPPRRHQEQNTVPVSQCQQLYESKEEYYIQGNPEPTRARRAYASNPPL